MSHYLTYVSYYLLNKSPEIICVDKSGKCRVRHSQQMGARSAEKFFECIIDFALRFSNKILCVEEIWIPVLAHTVCVDEMRSRSRGNSLCR